MSFSVKAKTEVAMQPTGGMFENLAELSAMIKTCGQLEKGATVTNSACPLKYCL